VPGLLQRFPAIAKSNCSSIGSFDPEARFPHSSLGGLIVFQRAFTRFDTLLFSGRDQVDFMAKQIVSSDKALTTMKV